MTWDNTLATAAQQYVGGVSLLTSLSNASMQAKCPSGHSQNRPGGVGENIARSWATGFTLTANTDFTSSVDGWYDEFSASGPYKNGGTFTGSGPCTGMCGHYTQVVWATANKIGCGVALCPHYATGMPGYLLVCQYDSSISGASGGNMKGATLFTKGTACSKCPSGFSSCNSQNLCAAR